MQLYKIIEGSGTPLSICAACMFTFQGIWPPPAKFARYHVCVKLVPLDALAQEGLFLHGLHRGALVHADKAEVVQLTLVNAAPLRQLVVGGYQKHQLILRVWHCLLTSMNPSAPQGDRRDSVTSSCSRYQATLV